MLLDFLRRRASPRIASSFGLLSPKPFPRSQSPAYEARYEPGCYTLELRRASYFAWEPLADGRRMSDIALQAEVETDPSHGRSAVGFLVRYLDEQSFYAFLVSPSGHFRFDLLRNNHPTALVEWTPLGPEPGAAVEAPEAQAAGASPSRYRVRIVAHGSRFTFAVNDEWVGEIEDETLPSGGLAFAAQSFEGVPRGVFRLRRLELDARPLVVERDHYRWAYSFPALPGARLRLAQTLAAQGSHAAAAVQLRKGLKGREGSVRERLLLAECYIRLSLHGEALAEVGEVLRREPANPAARAQKATALYLANRLLESRDELSAGLADGSLAASPVLLNLLGNAEYGLGNWTAAVDAYRRALALQPGQPLVLRNAARGLEQAGCRDEALPLYLEAARAMFKEGDYAELSLVVARALALDPGNREVRGLEAKVLYHEGRREDAFEKLSALAAEGETDSAVHYLLGLTLNEGGRREEALPHLEEAARREPGFALYSFRLAETLHALGRDPRPALQAALALAPNDPWINNLEGMLRLEEGDPAGALAPLRAAREAAPAEIDILVNLAEALSASGGHDEALELLARVDEDPVRAARLANQRGNILARRGRYEQAVQEYEAAVRADPSAHAYKENCAAACIEMDMIHRAEELLAQVEPEHPSAAVYNMIGTIAALKGERLRAEAAWRAALDRDPANPDVAVNLALLSLEKGDWQAARDAAAAVLARAPTHARAAALRDRIRAAHERSLSCAACGRQWWVPRDLPPQPGLSVRGEPPAQAPAGRCTTCLKVYCVGCAPGYVRDGRLSCAQCGTPLKLTDDALRWLLVKAIDSAPGTGST